MEGLQKQLVSPKCSKNMLLLRAIKEFKKKHRRAFSPPLIIFFLYFPLFGSKTKTTSVLGWHSKCTRIADSHALVTVFWLHMAYMFLCYESHKERQTLLQSANWNLSFWVGYLKTNFLY